MVAAHIATTTAATIVKFIGFISARNYDPLPTFFAPGAEWWTAGNPDLPGDSGGTSDAASHIATLKAAKTYDEYSYTIKNQVTEGYKSIVEGQVIGNGPQDLYYVNNLTMAFTLDNQYKIVSVHEYLDRIQVNWLLQWFKDHNVTIG